MCLVCAVMAVVAEMSQQHPNMSFLAPSRFYCASCAPPTPSLRSLSFSRVSFSCNIQIWSKVPKRFFFWKRRNSALRRTTRDQSRHVLCAWWNEVRGFEMKAKDGIARMLGCGTPCDDLG